MNEERLSAIIGIRVYPSWKKQMAEEALGEGKTLSEYLFGLLEVGWEQANVQQKPQTQ